MSKDTSREVMDIIYPDSNPALSNTSVFVFASVQKIKPFSRCRYAHAQECTIQEPSKIICLLNFFRLPIFKRMPCDERVKQRGRANKNYFTSRLNCLKRLILCINYLNYWALFMYTNHAIQAPTTKPCSQ